MDVLVRIAAGEGAVVARATIIDAVWATRYVSDSVLTRAIAEIRRALGDSPASPRYLETVTKRGYRVVATVTPCPADALTQAQSSLALTLGDRTVRLAEGETVIGRDRAATVRLESPQVSRRHARVVVHAGSAILEDLGSRNGTFLNGARLTRPAPLADGDLIVVGDIELSILREGCDGTTITGS